MPKIQELSPHIANLIAAGEVVERPASVVKELLENAVDAGASQVTIEIRDGGMTFLRVTDNGCGMAPEDAAVAFRRHATSKLRAAEDLAAIGTMGFRGEALAAIASVSRIDLMTKTPGSLSGTGLKLEAGQILEQTEVGCPDGTTIIVRDLFFNTPARMKFMKSDAVEGARVATAVQLQALAHPEVAIRFLRDGKQLLSTPGKGGLQAAVYCVYGRECAQMAEVSSRWEQYSVAGFVSKPTDARPSRALQTFFVNDRPVKSRLLVSALEEAYRNQLMVGKFPACVLHLTLPPGAVDVNVHPAKTEVKFLNEKAVFDCVHYGVLAALNKQPDRPQVQFQKEKSSTLPAEKAVIAPQKAPVIANQSADWCGNPPTIPNAPRPSHNNGIKGRQEGAFRAMTAQEYRAFAAALENAPQPDKQAASATLRKMEATGSIPLREHVILPQTTDPREEKTVIPEEKPTVIGEKEAVIANQSADWCGNPPVIPEAPVIAEPPEMEQTTLAMPQAPQWRYVGELYNTYILVEEGDNAFLIDKHAAHERILFEKLKANQEAITAQTLLEPMAVTLNPTAAGELLANGETLTELGFSLEEFGDNTILLRQIPMDLNPGDAAEAVEALADSLLSGRRARKDTVRDELLHTVACKAAIKAGWVTSEEELKALAARVMADESLKYCPHGRPICVTLSKKQLEKQFKRA